MKKKFLLPVVLFFTAMIVQAQSATDNIYLKTGTVIRGEIQELVPNDHVTIDDHCGNTWNFPMDEVEKITKEPYIPARGKVHGLGFEPGFVNITSMGLLAGSPDNTQVAPFSLQMVNGWRMDPGIFAGAGFGIEFLSTTYIPLFLEVGYDLPGTDVVPFIIARCGYSLPTSADQSQYDVDYRYSGGMLGAGGIGLKIRTRAHFAWDIMLLYRYQKTSYTETYDYSGQKNSYTNIYNRIELRLGFYID
jgi:hypothetical protein